MKTVRNWALHSCLTACLAIVVLPPTLWANETPEEEAAERHGHEIRLINRYLERFHYRDFKLDDEFSVELTSNYIDNLDPAKLFFTQSDISEFSKIDHYFDDYIRSGDTQAASQIFEIYRERVNQRIDYALQRIEHTFNFKLIESYQTDRKDELWVSNVPALNTLWRKRIKNDLLDLTLSGDTQEEAKEKLIKRYGNIQRRTSQITDNEIFQLFANAYATSIEPHTSYFSPRASEEFNIHMRLSLQGIGAVLRLEDEITEVIRVVPGGPADQSGQIHPKDKIIGVAQGEDGVYEDIIGWRLSDVVDKIRGEKGTKVKLSIQSDEMGVDAEPKDVVITRDNIKLESQAAKKDIIEVETQAGTSKLGVITLPSFYIDFQARSDGAENYRSTTRDVAKLLEEMQQDQVDGLVIDLRGNGGGSLEEVITLTGLFIDHGPVVQVRNKDGRITTHRDHQKGTSYNGPLAVMVDRQSASASEIFAGAIQDYNRGLIIGEPTFGKGTVQNVLPLNLYAGEQYKDKLGQIKITIAQFFRVNGDSTQHRGVIPDIGWPLPYSQDDFGESAYDNALPWANIRESDYLKTDGVNSMALDEVESLHNARIKNDSEFLASLKKLEVLTLYRKETRLSLNLETRSSKREQFNLALLETENQIRLAEGLEAFDTYAQLRDAAKSEEDNSEQDSEFSADVFLSEAGKILNDYRHSVSSSTAVKQSEAAVDPAI
jgi:carboxyl-terminal processing protease